MSQVPYPLHPPDMLWRPQELTQPFVLRPSAGPSASQERGCGAARAWEKPFLGDLTRTCSASRHSDRKDSRCWPSACGGPGAAPHTCLKHFPSNLCSRHHGPFYNEENGGLREGSECLQQVCWPSWTAACISVTLEDSLTPYTKVNSLYFWLKT